MRTSSQAPEELAGDVAGPGRLMRPKDVTVRLNISARTFERLLSAGKFPRPDLRIGRLTLWKPETVARWIDEESARQGGRGGHH